MIGYMYIVEVDKMQELYNYYREKSFIYELSLKILRHIEVAKEIKKKTISGQG